MPSNIKNHTTHLSRRNLLKGIGGVGLAAASANVFPGSFQPALAESAITPPAAVSPVVTPFALESVALLDSPFLRARTRSGEYLLSLDTDRLLHQFRVNAGLAAKAAVYGGWESAPTWADIHCQGHTLGHYLSGCALMYGSAQDVRFKQRCDYIVAELQACQVATKSGLLTAFPEGNGLMDAVLSGKPYTGVPWYTTHKVLAGLRDASMYTHNPVAREVLVRFADWAVTATSDLTETQFQKMLEVEHGGMNEVLGDISQMTGDARYLALAQRFCDHAILDPLAKSRDNLDGMHANTQIPKIVGFQRLHQLTGEPSYLNAADFFWRTVVTTRSFINGNHGDNEHFFPIADFDKHVFSAKTSETCCDYNMLKLTRLLFQQSPSAHLTDFYERALYNDILASQDPDSGMVTYFQGNRPGYMKLYCTPTDSFWCCTGSGMENHAKYNDSIYFRGANDLYVSLFIPSVATWQQGVKLTQTNHFPEEPRTTLQWSCTQPAELTLHLRHPYWCRTATVRINEKPFLTSNRPSSYMELKRTWHDGDTISLELPMELQAVQLPGNPDIVAFQYGPIVLAGELGSEGIAPGADITVNERLYGSVLNTPITPPTLSGDPASLIRSATPGPAPLTFNIPSAGPSSQVKLAPYYKIAHQRYATYWKLAPEPDHV